MDNSVWLFLLGAITSVLLPYLREWLDSKAAFDWRKVAGQLLATGGVVASQVVGLVDLLGDATLAQAFALGWGVNSLARFVQKSSDTIRN